MPVQDDARETQLVQLFNLYVPQDRRRDQTDAFLRFNGLELPFELKSTSGTSVSTVRDFGPDHIAKWKDLHWIFGFYNRQETLLYCHYASPGAMAAWVSQKADYVYPDSVLAHDANRQISLDTLDSIFGDRKTVYSPDDAHRIMKHQWPAERYLGCLDRPTGYSPERMVEMLKERCTYLVTRGATLNNPKIPGSYFDDWEKITSDHASRLRELVRDYLAKSALETDTATM
jgi:hypothetical protein